MSEPEQEESKGGEDVVNVLTDIMAPVDDDFDEEVKTLTPAKKVVVKKVTKATKSTAQTKTVKKPASPATAKSTKQAPTPATSEEPAPKTETTSEQPPKTTPSTTATTAATTATTPAKSATTSSTPVTKTKKVIKKTPASAKSGGAAATKQATAKPTAGKSTAGTTGSAAKKKPVKVVKKPTPASGKAKPAAPAEESVDKAKAETVESAKAQEETAITEKEETLAPENTETPMETNEDDQIKDIDNSAEISTEAVPDVEISKEGADEEEDEEQEEEEEEEEDEEEEGGDEEDGSNIVEGDANGDDEDMEPPDFNDSFDVRSEASSSSSGSQIDEAESDHDSRQRSRRDRKRQFSPIVYEGEDISDSEDDDDSNKKAKLSSSVNDMKGGDQTAKMKYLFRDARYFLIKSNNHENIALAKAKGSSKVRSRHQPDEPGPGQVGLLQESSCRTVGRGGNSHSGTFLRPAKKNRNNSYSAAVNHALKRKYSTAPATATSESIPECSRTGYADSRDNRERSPKVLNARTHFQRNSVFDEECERVHIQVKQSVPRTCENLRGRSHDKPPGMPHRYIYRRQKAHCPGSNRDPGFSYNGHSDISFESAGLNEHGLDDLSFEDDDGDDDDDGAFYPSPSQRRRESRWRRSNFSDNYSNFGYDGGHDAGPDHHHFTESSRIGDTSDMERLLHDASAKLNDQSSMHHRIQQLESVLGNVLAVLGKLVHKSNAPRLQRSPRRARRKVVSQYEGASRSNHANGFNRWRGDPEYVNGKRRRIEGDSELDERLVENPARLNEACEVQQTLEGCGTRSDHCEGPVQHDGDENAEEENPLSDSGFQMDSRPTDSSPDNDGDIIDDHNVGSSSAEACPQNGRVENDHEQNIDNSPNNSSLNAVSMHQADENIAQGKEDVHLSRLRSPPDAGEPGATETENPESVVQETTSSHAANEVIHEETNDTSALEADEHSLPATIAKERNYQIDASGPVIVHIKSEFSCDTNSWPDSSRPSNSYNHPEMAPHGRDLVVLSDDSSTSDNPVFMYSTEAIDAVQSAQEQQERARLSHEQDAENMQSLQEIFTSVTGSSAEDVFHNENELLKDQHRWLKVDNSRNNFQGDESQFDGGRTELPFSGVHKSQGRSVDNYVRVTKRRFVQQFPGRLAQHDGAIQLGVQNEVPHVLGQNGHTQHKGMPGQSHHSSTNLSEMHQSHIQRLQQSFDPHSFHPQPHSIDPHPQTNNFGRRTANLKNSTLNGHTDSNLPRTVNCTSDVRALNTCVKLSKKGLRDGNNHHTGPPPTMASSISNLGSLKPHNVIPRSVPNNAGPNPLHFGSQYSNSSQSQSHSTQGSPAMQWNQKLPWQAGNCFSPNGSSGQGQGQGTGTAQFNPDMDTQADGIIADVLAQRNWSQARSAVDGATSLSRALAQALFGDSILIKSTFRSSGKSKDLTELDPVLVKKIENAVMNMFCQGKNVKFCKQMWSLCKQSLGQRMKYLRNRYSTL
ncbi:uncharacterized protein LOC577966 isoform X2 [Strongylocentrotus purpuratus]|uniref:BEN domain-containing protein n=1 Tax=Strongylocentrotus purpuratus TaxID=7668 RepID=A0A7M7HJ72_STRPU|nr:uncharacterized protein LOC577966 isoform X2 [Strongylocentrotus purpuratus]